MLEKTSKFCIRPLLDGSFQELRPFWKGTQNVNAASRWSLSSAEEVVYKN